MKPASGNAPYPADAIVMPATDIGSRHVGEYMENVDGALAKAGWRPLIDWRDHGDDWYAFVVKV